MKKLLCLFILILPVSIVSAQGLIDELQQLYRIDQLPQYRDGVVKEFSSFDTTGGNDDGFRGTYSFLRMEGKKQVIAEMTGSGVINRIFTPTPSEDTIEFYFDGEKLPRISMPFSQLFAGNKFPFIDPICGHEVGGYYCYLPIPYSKSCKVLFSGKMLFYQLQYRTYSDNTQVKSFTMDWDEKEIAELKRAANVWGKYGTNFLGDLYQNFKVVTTEVRIGPGEKKSVFELKKGGRIIGIEVKGINKLKRDNNQLILKAKWENEDVWAINAPIKDFFGYYYGEESMRSLLGGSSGDNSYFYYPMPFSKSALVELELQKSVTSETAVTDLSVRVYYLENPKENNEGKFYTHWRRDNNPEEGQPYVIVPRIGGRGHFVGTILCCQGHDPGSTGYFEGDDIATIDGELTIHGTGSEDFFNGGYYDVPDRWDMAHSLPSHGCLGYSSPLGRTGAYRHYFTDKLSFSKDFNLTIEHGPVGNKSRVDYRSVAFYYADKSSPQNSPTAYESEYPARNSVIYNALHLKTSAIRNGVIVSGDRVGQQRVLILESSKSQSQMLVKFVLATSSSGTYKLYCSYFRTPLSGEVRIMKRQVLLSDWKNLKSQEEMYVKREYIGTVNVQDDECTVTFHIKGDNSRKLFLNEIILEKE